MTELAVCDTHALIWYASGAHRKLGAQARRIFERADAGRAAIYVPVIVLVEVSELARLRRIELGMPFSDWETALFSAGKYLAAELIREVVRAADRLHAIPERSDRLIAATAVSLDCPAITRDAAIGSAAGIDVLW